MAGPTTARLSGPLLCCQPGVAVQIVESRYLSADVLATPLFAGLSVFCRLRTGALESCNIRQIDSKSQTLLRHKVVHEKACAIS